VKKSERIERVTSESLPNAGDLEKLASGVCSCQILSGEILGTGGESWAVRYDSRMRQWKKESAHRRKYRSKRSPVRVSDQLHVIKSWALDVGSPQIHALEAVQVRRLLVLSHSSDSFPEC
jgi:hypothetical protein